MDVDVDAAGDELFATTAKCVCECLHNVRHACEINAHSLSSSSRFRTAQLVAVMLSSHCRRPRRLAAESKGK